MRVIKRYTMVCPPVWDVSLWTNRGITISNNVIFLPFAFLPFSLCLKWVVFCDLGISWVFSSIFLQASATRLLSCIY